MQLLLCLMLERVKLLESFESWPLHVTIVPWFELTKTQLPGLLKQSEQLAAKIRAIEINPTQTSWFGPHQNILVAEIAASTELTRLHEQTLKILSELNCRVLDTKHLGPNFRPHITLNNRNKKSLKKSYLVNDLCFVAAGPKSIRQVVEELKLSAI